MPSFIKVWLFLYVAGAATGYLLRVLFEHNKKRRFWIHKAYVSEMGRLYVTDVMPVKNKDSYIEVVEAKCKN